SSRRRHTSCSRDWSSDVCSSDLMNGLANIRTNGLLLGMSEGELASRRDDIIAFAELGPFIHEPLRTYSSGMVMRLAFAIAIHARSEERRVGKACTCRAAPAQH